MSHVHVSPAGLLPPPPLTLHRTWGAGEVVRHGAQAPYRRLEVAAGEAHLLLPSGFDANDGIARIVANPEAADRTVPVPVRRLDDVLGDVQVDVLKMDVEGHEPRVLEGAEALLRRRRIRHVVFEEHRIADSETVRLLGDAGFTIFAVGWTLHRLHLQSVAAAGLARSYEAPNFVATLDEEGLRSACAARGWHSLRAGLGRG